MNHCLKTLLAAALLLCIASAQAASLKINGTTDLTGTLYQSEGESFPASLDSLSGILSRLHEIKRGKMLGGSYWFHAEINNDSGNTEWVLEPDFRLIDRIDARVYIRDQPVQQFVTGYQAEHDYMLHYGKLIHLPPGGHAEVLIHFENLHFAFVPAVRLYTEHDYQHLVLLENVMILAALGALLTLAVYNLFIYRTTHDRALLYYAAYLIACFLGWAFMSQLPAELFGWHDQRWQYVPFFLLPVFNTLFYLDFLRLDQRFPRLRRASLINIALPLILLPSCFINLSYAHILMTVVDSLWILIALSCGIASLSSGFRPARYFVLAFVAFLIPAIIILGANWGFPDLIRNSKILVLLGNTADGVLLSFALADKIRMLSEEKNQALQRMEKMLVLTRTDHLTGIANRHAFDQHFECVFRHPDFAEDPAQLVLFLIDLDNLKQVNDHRGHAKGDELLSLFAGALSRLESDSVSAFRLGGDEFTLLAHKHDEDRLVNALAQLEKDIRAQGFGETGISYGIAHAGESSSAKDMLLIADRRMYDNKASKRKPGMPRVGGWDTAPKMA
jgi:diguanylate cyclase (GGDEF)-like protein